MTWGQEDVLVGLWGLIPLALFVAWTFRSRRRALARLGPLVAQRLSRAGQGIHRVRLALAVAAVGLAVLALAQPRYGYQYQEIPRKGIDIIVVLDLSTSMLAEDVDPSRLGRAQREAIDLADRLTGDRIGLVGFAAGGQPHMPLTQDYGAFRRQVRRMHPDRVTTQGSDLGAGLLEARELLGDQAEADRAIIVISDGEDHGERAAEVAGKLAEEGVHLYAIGVGRTDGAPIPLSAGGFKKDRGGDVVLSRLVEGPLESIARVGKGAYARSVAGTSDIEAIYDDEIRGRLEGAELGMRREKIWEERYQWPLGLALALWLLGMVRRPGPLRLGGRAAAAALALVVALPAWSTELTKLEAAHAADPDDPATLEALARGLFEAGDLPRSRALYGQLAQQAADSETRERARFNQGLARYGEGDLVGALEDWDGVLQADPEHEAAQHNREAVAKEIAARLQQQEQQQDGQQEQQQQDGQQEQQQQDGQDGQPQQGEPQQGEQGAQQDPQQTDADAQPPPDDAEAEAQPYDGGGDTGNIGSRGEISEAGEDSEGDDDGEEAQVPAEGTGDTGDADEGPPASPGAMSAEEAERVVDSVEEGNPRARHGGRSKGKDW